MDKMINGASMMEIAGSNSVIAKDLATVRTMNIDGELWFIGKDVAACLGYKNTKKALGDHVEPNDKMLGDGVTFRDRLGREQKPVLINEAGFYSLVMSSKLPGAKKFKRWITSEVLPSIRKSSGYIAGQEELSEVELMEKALIVARKTFSSPLQCLDKMKECY